MREAAFRATRLIGSVLPLPVLAGLLYPIGFLRGVQLTLTDRGKRPPMTLPPGARRVSALTAVRIRALMWMGYASLTWSDRFTRSPWKQRINLEGLDDLRALAADRPVMLASFHFGGIFVMPNLLRANGIPTAAAVGARLFPLPWLRERRALLTQIDDLPAHLRSGDARGLTRYLKPGRCLLVALDYVFGEQESVRFNDSTIQLSTPVFRLAKVTNAVVVPALATIDGNWRYSIHFGKPVPDEFIKAGNNEAALAHIVNALLPIAAHQPTHAHPQLVSAFQAARA